MPYWWALTATALLSGCTLSHPARPVVTTAGSISSINGLVCHMEKLTGTLLATRVCTTQAEREAMQERAQGVQDALTRSPAALCPQGVNCVGH